MLQVFKTTVLESWIIACLTLVFIVLLTYIDDTTVPIAVNCNILHGVASVYIQCPIPLQYIAIEFYDINIPMKDLEVSANLILIDEVHGKLNSYYIDNSIFPSYIGSTHSNVSTSTISHAIPVFPLIDLSIQNYNGYLCKDGVISNPFFTSASILVIQLQCITCIHNELLGIMDNNINVITWSSFGRDTSASMLLSAITVCVIIHFLRQLLTIVTTNNTAANTSTTVYRSCVGVMRVYLSSLSSEQIYALWLLCCILVYQGSYLFLYILTHPVMYAPGPNDEQYQKWIHMFIYKCVILMSLQGMCIYKCVILMSLQGMCIYKCVYKVCVYISVFDIMMFILISYL